MEQKMIETNDAVKPQKLTKRQKTKLERLEALRQEHPKDEILDAISDGCAKIAEGLSLLLQCEYYQQHNFSGYAQTPIDRINFLIEVIDSELNELYQEQD